MRTVEFIQNKSIGMEAYNCGCSFNSDKYCRVNHSGTYVLASEANERIKVLEDALKNLVQAVDVLNSIRPDDPCSKVEKWNIVFKAQEDAHKALEVKNVNIQS